MKRKDHCLQGIMAAIGLLVLIFDSSLALEGARSGIELCIRTVIPALFPFFVLSMMLTNTLSVTGSNGGQLLNRLLGIPAAAAPVLIPAVFGGYPVGAKCVGDLYQRHRISKAEAERLLAFCSNAGPSFLFGMVSGFFPERKMIWMLWLIHLTSAALTAAGIPAVNADRNDFLPKEQPTGNPVMLSAAKAMVTVCCWVILFRIVVFFLNDWFLWLMPGWLQVLVIGALELTNGCCELLLVKDVNLRFMLCACLLSFGGLCVLFQTASVTKGLSLGYYFKGKLMQTFYSLLLSFGFVAKQGMIFAAFIPIMILIFRKLQNRYGNHSVIPV